MSSDVIFGSFGILLSVLAGTCVWKTWMEFRSGVFDLSNRRTRMIINHDERPGDFWANFIVYIVFELCLLASGAYLAYASTSSVLKRILARILAI